MRDGDCRRPKSGIPGHPDSRVHFGPTVPHPPPSVSNLDDLGHGDKDFQGRRVTVIEGGPKEPRSSEKTPSLMGTRLCRPRYNDGLSTDRVVYDGTVVSSSPPSLLYHYL